MAGSEEPEICTYCDATATTLDHVPPKLIFPRPRPSLITVPSCAACNTGASLDDEYFLSVVALEEKAAEHPAATASHSKILRALKKPNKRGFREAFLASVQEVERVSPAGIITGRAPLVSVDNTRLDRVIERTTRGLFRHHVGYRLPLRCHVQAHTSRAIDPGAHEALRSVLDLVETVKHTQMHVLGEETFCYRFAIADGCTNSSFWVFVAYKAVTFISMVIDPEENGGSPAA